MSGDPFEAAADDALRRAREREAAQPSGNEDESQDEPSPPRLGRRDDAADPSTGPLKRNRERFDGATRELPRGDGMAPPVATPPTASPVPHPLDDGRGRFEGEFANDPGWFEPGPRNVQLCYWLNLAGFLIVVLPLASVAMAFWNRRRVGPGLASHYTYAIRTVGLGWLYGIAGYILLGDVTGVALFALAILFMARNLRGLTLAGAGKPIPNPRTWLL